MSERKTLAYWRRYDGCVECGVPARAPCVATGASAILAGTELGFAHAGRRFLALREEPPASPRSIEEDVVRAAVREGVVVRPGDTLVLRVDPEHGAPVPAELDQIRTFMEASLPRGARCVIIAMPGDLGVIRAGEDQPRHTLVAEFEGKHDQEAT